MKVNLSKVKSHQQLDENSCIPSAVEMVLKLNDKVCEDYHKLQTEWYNKKYTSFDYFHGRICEGLEFTRVEQKADQLFQTIDKEINEGRYVIISLENINQSCYYHMWIIYGKSDDNDYLNFSKNHESDRIFSFREEFSGNLKDYVRQLGKTDILIYNSKF